TVTSFSELAVVQDGACVPEPMSDAQLTLTHLKPPPTDDQLLLKATIALAPGTTIADVATKTGLGVVLGDRTAGAVAGAHLPAGAFNTATKRGWTKKQGGKVWRYVDRTASPPGGIRRVVLTTKGVDGTGRPLAAIVAKGRGASYVAGTTAQATVA